MIATCRSACRGFATHEVLSIFVDLACNLSKNRFITGSHPSTMPSLVPLYTVGRTLVWSRLAINAASSLDMALDFASVNLSCSGDMGTSSLAAGGRRLLPRVELKESSEFSKIVASLGLVLLVQCGTRQLFHPKLHSQFGRYS